MFELGRCIYLYLMYMHMPRCRTVKHRPKGRRRKSRHAGSRKTRPLPDNMSKAEQVFSALDRCKKDQNILREQLSRITRELRETDGDLSVCRATMLVSGISIPESVGDWFGEQI